MQFSQKTETKTTLDTLKELYPHLTIEELSQAEDTIKRYVQFVIEIAESIQSNPELQTKYEQLQNQLINQELSANHPLLTEAEESSSLNAVEY